MARFYGSLVDMICSNYRFAIGYLQQTLQKWGKQEGEHPLTGKRATKVR